jgi:hypothetical protein
VIFAVVRSEKGQPLNDKRNGPSTMARWERQSDSIRSSKTGIEKTKRAIEREKNLIDNVNSLELPPAIKTAMESGNITQWRKHPNRFFVKGVEKGRIVYFPETGTIGHHYLMDIPKEQYPLFRDTYNQLRKDLQKPAAPAPAPLSRAAALVQSVRSKPGYGVARASAAGNRELVGLRMKEKNKPATPKFSRGGQLAPGRGTEERKQDARFLLTLPKEARSAIVLAKRTFKNKGIPGSNPLGPSYAHDVYDASIKARKQFNEKDKILKSTAYKIIEAGKALKDIIKPAKTASGFTVRSAYAADLQLPSSMGGPKKGYIAKITDTDPKYKLKREFLKGSYDGAGTNYKITEKGIYETQSQSLQNRNKIDRTYELQGRNKTKELWLSNDQSGMRRGSVERAIRLLKLFSKKQP